MQQSFTPRYFRNLGFPVGPLGLGSSYGLGAKGVERAFDHGVPITGNMPSGLLAPTQPSTTQSISSIQKNHR
jgi:hypothetical protein